MGQPIDNLPNDFVVSLKDKLVGTDDATGNSMNYPIEDIIALVESVTGGLVNTTNINEITELIADDWVDQLNASDPVWTVNTADLPIVVVSDTGEDEKATYIYKKSSTTQIKIGIGSPDVVIGDFLKIRDISEEGETNTMSSKSGDDGVDIWSAKSGVNFPMRKLKAGALGTISVSVESDGIHIDTTAALGESNTISSAGGVSLYKTKTGVELVFKGLSGDYCGVYGDTDDVVITPWGKIVRSASFTVSSTDTQRSIHIDNGATPVVITIPDTLGEKFEMGVQQIGTGQVSFAVSGTATLEYTPNKLKGQGATCFVETHGSDQTRILITGGIKA